MDQHHGECSRNSDGSDAIVGSSNVDDKEHSLKQKRKIRAESWSVTEALLNCLHRYRADHISAEEKERKERLLKEKERYERLLKEKEKHELVNQIMRKKNEGLRKTLHAKSRK